MRPRRKRATTPSFVTVIVRTGCIDTACAGLSKASFQSISSLSQPFFCPRCLQVRQSEELSNLKKTVDTLSAEVSELKAQVLSLSSENAPRPESTTVPVKSSSEVPFTSVTQRQLARTARMRLLQTLRPAMNLIGGSMLSCLVYPKCPVALLDMLEADMTSKRYHP